MSTDLKIYINNFNISEDQRGRARIHDKQDELDPKVILLGITALYCIFRYNNNRLTNITISSEEPYYVSDIKVPSFKIFLSSFTGVDYHIFHAPTKSDNFHIEDGEYRGLLYPLLSKLDIGYNYTRKDLINIVEGNSLADIKDKFIFSPYEYKYFTNELFLIYPGDGLPYHHPFYYPYNTSGKLISHSKITDLLSLILYYTEQFNELQEITFFNLDKYRKQKSGKETIIDKYIINGIYSVSNLLFNDNKSIHKLNYINNSRVGKVKSITYSFNDMLKYPYNSLLNYHITLEDGTIITNNIFNILVENPIYEGSTIYYSEDTKGIYKYYPYLVITPNVIRNNSTKLNKCINCPRCDDDVIITAYKERSNYLDYDEITPLDNIHHVVTCRYCSLSTD